LRFEEETSRGVGSNDEKRGGGGGRGFAVDRRVNNFARDAASAYHDVAREGSRRLALKLHLSVSINNIRTGHKTTVSKTFSK